MRNMIMKQETKWKHAYYDAANATPTVPHLVAYNGSMYLL